MLLIGTKSEDSPTPVEWKQLRSRIAIHKCFEGDRSVVTSSSMAFELGIDGTEDPTDVKCTMKCTERAEVECFQQTSTSAAALLGVIVLAASARNATCQTFRDAE